MPDSEQTLHAGFFASEIYAIIDSGLVNGVETFSSIPLWLQLAKLKAAKSCSSINHSPIQRRDYWCLLLLSPHPPLIGLPGSKTTTRILEAQGQILQLIWSSLSPIVAKLYRIFGNHLIRCRFSLLLRFLWSYSWRLRLYYIQLINKANFILD
jgi:hypothetical protein